MRDKGCFRGERNCMSLIKYRVLKYRTRLARRAPVWSVLQQQFHSMPTQIPADNAEIKTYIVSWIAFAWKVEIPYWDVTNTLSRRHNDLKICTNYTTVMRVNNRWVRKLLIVHFCGNSMSMLILLSGLDTLLKLALIQIFRKDYPPPSSGSKLGLLSARVYVNGPGLVPSSASTLLYLTDSLPV